MISKIGGRRVLQMKFFGDSETEKFDEAGITPFGKRVVKSSIWAFSDRVIQQILFFTRTLILARLLSPGDFGIFGISLLAITILSTFSKSGFDLALIQKKSDIRPYLDTAWTINLIRGMFRAAALFLSAPFIADFFNSPGVVPVVRVLALSELVNSSQNVGMVYLQKELEFGKRFVFSVTVGIAGLIVGVTAVYFLRDVRALVYASLAGSIAGLVTSYIIHPYRPSLNIDLGKAKEMFKFGKYIWGTSVLKFFILHGDDAFLGKILGPAALGLYQMAYRISNIAATEISNVLSDVAFPAYSKIQDQSHKLRIGYLKTIKITTLFAFPIAGGLLILSPEFVRLVLGEQWISMIPAMRILCLLGMLKSIGFDDLFKSVGRPDIPTKISLVRLMAMVVTIYPLTLRLGMQGTALSVLISSFFVIPIGLYHMSKTINYKIRDFLKLLSFPFTATALMVFIVSLLKRTISDINIASLALLITSGLVFYFAAIYLINMIFREYQLISLIKEIKRGWR
ncbi:MAG: hypothetical protein A2Z72_08105 [Omnitrophica bacterium RBG_13_46_9]|nr:MAG: hypothetical protein A2Z72_08105 [Omnitrophica bacterium RBG_13_46_9]